jgi:hypothetical protein
METQVAQNEMALGVPINDDKLVRVYLKIRAARTKLSKEYDVADDALKQQLSVVSGEIMRRLLERGATQTKTPDGTAFFGEDMQVTIADEDVFKNFVLEARDLNWYQKRVKIEHLREYMKANQGRLPPGINVFRERTVLVRAPKRDKESEVVDVEEFEQPTAAAAA